jgi:enoyl-CoA hydratase/carnithine racemase
VLRATGPAFSAGLDLRMFSPEGIAGETAVADLAVMPTDDAEAAIAQFQDAFSWWVDLDVLTVAVVQGAAVGAGFQLALACDQIVCAADARFAMKETSLGLVPDLAGTWPLVGAVGYRRALEICLSGRWVSAAEAQELGLATRVVPVGEQDDAALDLVSSLLAGPDGAVRATRRLLRDAATRGPVEQRGAERAEQAARLRDLLSG